jgi:hypothetical protein
MKRSTEQKIEQALESLADGLAEIGGMGLLELRFKFKSILARVEKKVREAVSEMKEDR